jgi:hypothetical protein
MAESRIWQTAAERNRNEDIPASVSDEEIIGRVSDEDDEEFEDVDDVDEEDEDVEESDR